MADFQEYYSGKRKAPVLTIFIGGNHECSSYLQELKYGGWVAPNIYYLGEFGSIWYKGLQITDGVGFSIIILSSLTISIWKNYHLILEQ